jgi:hypothetical protein
MVHWGAYARQHPAPRCAPHPSKGARHGRPSLLKGRAWLRTALSYAYLGDGSCLSGLVDGLGLDGSGPLLSEAVGPPGVVAGTFP